MYIPCVQCGKKDYTEESPLWYHCHSCLHEKELLYSCCICLQKYDPAKSMFVNYCEKCGKLYRDKLMFMRLIRNVACPVCGRYMDYYLLPGDYDHYECECGHTEEVG